MESSRVLIVALFLIISSLQTSEALIINTTTATCSKTCESKDCLFPPLLRYGKYCGIGYTGCAGELPCDGLDACCQAHDSCIGTNIANYLNVTCNRQLLECVWNFEMSGSPQFQGASCGVPVVATTIELVMEIAVHLEHEESINRGT